MIVFFIDGLRLLNNGTFKTRNAPQTARMTIKRVPVPTAMLKAGSLGVESLLAITLFAGVDEKEGRKVGVVEEVELIIAGEGEDVELGEGGDKEG